MRKFLLAGAALLSLAAVQAPAAAQDMGTPGSQPPGDSMTPPADPASSASPTQAANPPADPAASPSMPPASDPNAGQPAGAVPPDTGMVPAPAGVPRDPSAPVGSDANPVTVGGNMTPPPTETKQYPVCSRTVQDSCVNPGEGRRGRMRR